MFAPENGWLQFESVHAVCEETADIREGLLLDGSSRSHMPGVTIGFLQRRKESQSDSHPGPERCAPWPLTI